MRKKINKITLIIRGYSLEEVLMVAEEANKYDCFNLEVTTNTDHWEEIIKALISRHYENIVIGAGTILDFSLLERAVLAGSEFVLAPIPMSKSMLDYCNKHDVISVPAAFSPGEIYEMKIDGADIIKLFTAIDLPDNDVELKWHKALIKFVCNGYKNNVDDSNNGM